MNAAYFTLFAVIIASTVASCKKDDEEATPGAPVDPNAAYSTSDFNTYDVAAGTRTRVRVAHNES